MSLRNSSLACLALFLTFSASIHALDITKLLTQYPEFKQLNKYLTETKLSDEINARKTATILALDDAALSSLSGKSTDTIKAILSTHVLLDFYDEKKLMEAQGSHAQLATLSSEGKAKDDKTGYIYVNLINEGEVAFGSAVEGSTVDVMLVRTVTTEPDVVSILQVSKPIVVPGIEKGASSVGGNIAVSPDSNAPAPGPSSDASSNTKILGFFAAVTTFASVFLSF